jgi:hypothetical protein
LSLEMTMQDRSILTPRRLRRDTAADMRGAFAAPRTPGMETEHRAVPAGSAPYEVSYEIQHGYCTEREILRP